MTQPTHSPIQHPTFLLLCTTFALFSLLASSAPSLGQSNIPLKNDQGAAQGKNEAKGKGQGAAASLTKVILNLIPADFGDKNKNAKEKQNNESNDPLKGYGTTVNGVLGADDRGACNLDKENFVPMAPGILTQNFDIKDPKKSPVQFTASSTPILYFFTSYKNPVTGKFKLYDAESEQLLNSFPVKVESSRGTHIFPVELPQLIKLVPEKRYIWHLSVYRGNDKSAFRGFKGIIQHSELSPKLLTQLNAPSALKNVNLYGRYRYWDKAVEELGTLEPHEQKKSLVVLAKQLNITNCLTPSS